MLNNLSTEAAWVIIIGTAGAVIVGSIVIDRLLIMLNEINQARLDRKFPQRLDRFKLEAYKQGVLDAAPKTTIIKKD